MREVKFGAPGYILLKDMSKDMAGTLKKVAALGYDGIEITGFFGHPAKEIREMCADAGIEPYGCFAELTSLVCESAEKKGGNWDQYAAAFAIEGEEPDDVMQYIKDIGCEYVGMLVPNGVMDESIIEKINLASSVARKYGMNLQYHNHNYEFNNMVNGQYRMDYIMEKTTPDMLFEPDLGWMEIAGYKSEKALRKYAQRIEIVHLKDYYRAQDDPALPHLFRPTGYGVMDWARLIPLCEEIIKPKWYVADHDSAYDGDIYDELGISLEYIKRMLSYC